MTRIASINKNEIRLALAQAISLLDSHGNVQSCNTKINPGESYTIE